MTEKPEDAYVHKRMRIRQETALKIVGMSDRAETTLRGIENALQEYDTAMDLVEDEYFEPGHFRAHDR